jgi:thioredoxin
MKSINSNKDFNNLVKSGKPFVIDFYADWCGPCQSLLPTVEKLAEEFKNEVAIVKVNIDKQRELAEKFKVRSIPSIFFMTKNQVKESINGLASEHTLRKKIKALV